MKGALVCEVGGAILGSDTFPTYYFFSFKMRVLLCPHAPPEHMCSAHMRLLGAHDQGAQEAKGPRKYVSSKLK
jgi:hypothetical protein